MIRLRISSGWSEPLLVSHTTLSEISCHGSCDPKSTHWSIFQLWMPVEWCNSITNMDLSCRPKRKTVRILISWLCDKLADMDLHFFFSKEGIEFWKKYVHSALIWIISAWWVFGVVSEDFISENRYGLYSLCLYNLYLFSLVKIFQN